MIKDKKSVLFQSKTIKLNQFELFRTLNQPANESLNDSLTNISE